MGKSDDRSETATRPSRRIGSAERDIVALGTATAAIALFVGTGGSVLTQVVQSLRGMGVQPDQLLVNALLLNSKRRRKPALCGAGMA